MEDLQVTDTMVNLIRDIQVLRYHGVGALFFLLWDTMISWEDEVQYIWPQSRSSPTKWIFLFTRYFGLLVQARMVSVNLSLNVLSVGICQQIYVSQVIFCGVLMACIQAILMLRVYALYIQDRRIAYAMIALLVAQLGSMPGIIYTTIPHNIGTWCMKTITIRDIVYFGVSAALPQLLVLGLTIIKFISGLRAGWGKIPIVFRLVRDNIILVSVILAWVIVTAGLTSVKNLYGYIGYYWLLSIIPSVGCRVVINMQQLANSKHARQQARADASSTLELTTCIFDVLSLHPTDSIPPFHSNSAQIVHRAPRFGSARSTSS